MQDNTTDTIDATNATNATNKVVLFSENIDLHIIEKLELIDTALKSLPVTEKNYPALLREYGNLIKLTSPLIEKLQRNRLDLDLKNDLRDLTLKIEGI